MQDWYYFFGKVCNINVILKWELKVKHEKKTQLKELGVKLHSLIFL